MYLLPPPSALLHQKIVIADRSKKHFITPAIIVDIETIDDFLYIYNKEGIAKRFCMPMKELMKVLKPLRAFCEVKKGKMVNIYEMNFQDAGSQKLEMSNGRTIVVSHRGHEKLWDMFLKIETVNLQYVIPFSNPEPALTD